MSLLNIPTKPRRSFPLASLSAREGSALEPRLIFCRSRGRRSVTLASPAAPLSTSAVWLPLFYFFFFLLLLPLLPPLPLLLLLLLLYLPSPTVLPFFLRPLWRRSSTAWSPCSKVAAIRCKSVVASAWLHCSLRSYGLTAKLRTIECPKKNHSNYRKWLNVVEES